MEQQQQCRKHTGTDPMEEVTVHEDPATLDTFIADIVSDTTFTTNDVEGRQGGSAEPQAVKRNILGGCTPGEGKKRKEAATGVGFVYSLSTYLHGSEIRREDRRKEAARKNGKFIIKGKHSDGLVGQLFGSAD